MTKRKIIKTNTGFTIIELLIATTVFAVVLLVAQTSFVHIGHLFYSGISISQTQEAADHIFQDINGNFQTASNVTGSQNYIPGVYDYYCIGNTRYTYRINNEINTDSVADYSVGGNFGILKDVLPGCGAPCDASAGSCLPGTVKFNNPTELLGNKMRVERLDVCQSDTTSNLYNVAIVLAYGDEDTLTYTDTSTPPTTSCQGSTHYSSVGCQSDAQNNFCAVSSINTAVYKGWHQ